MFRNVTRWFGSKQGKNFLIVSLALALILSLTFQFTGGSLAGLFGTAGPTTGGYSCLPTCEVNDGKFFSMPGEDMASFGGASTVVWIEVPEDASSFELGIFDGDSGKDNDGNVNMWEGNWDNTETPTTYTLYADPQRDGSGTTVVGTWHGNDDPMPNNDWYDITVNNVPEARHADGGYHYRLEATRPVEGHGINAFKLRSTGQLSTGRSELVNASFAIVGMIATQQDTYILYPEFEGDYNELGPCIYSGEWEFYFQIPPGTETITFWDGDFDRGTSASTDADTDDPNTIGIPEWANQYAVTERAGGRGSPADDYFHPLYRVEPAVYYEVLGPSGQPVFSNSEPSGTEEWENFVVSTNPETDADLYVDSIPTGRYTLRITGLDLHNTVWLRINYEISDDECPDCPICPECATCPECVCGTPTPTPTPAPPPETEPTPEPEACAEPTLFDLVYVLDTSSSMALLYPGPGDRLAAAQAAIEQLNEWVADQEDGSRVGLVAVRGQGTVEEEGEGELPDVQIAAEFTTDVDEVAAALENLQASGSPPTAQAMDQVAEWVLETRDPSHQTIVVLISDGITPMGEELHTLLPDVPIYNVAIQSADGGVPQGDSLRNTLEESGGGLFAAHDVEELVLALQWAYVKSACGEEGPSQPGDLMPVEPAPSEPSSSEPAIACASPQVSQYRVEYPTSIPFQGIGFTFESGDEVSRGAFDLYRIVLTEEEAASLETVPLEARAGNFTSRTVLEDCRFDQPGTCGPVPAGRFTFSFEGAADNGDGTRTLTFRVQNEHLRPLTQVTIGLPEDVRPSAPVESYRSEVCP